MKTLHQCIHRLHNPDLGTLFIRIALGVVFIHAGSLKLMNLDTTLAGFGSIGIPVWLAYVVMYAEVLSGIAMIVGIFVRYFGIILSVIMLVAMFKVHFVNGFGLSQGGYEYVFVLLLGALAVITQGAGKYSLARWLKKK